MLLGFLLRLSGIRGPDISCERMAKGGGVMYNGIAVGPMLARARCFFLLASCSSTISACKPHVSRHELRYAGVIRSKVSLVYQSDNKYWLDAELRPCGAAIMHPSLVDDRVPVEVDQWIKTSIG